MNRDYKAIIFDLDGTLLDTSLDLTDTLNHVRCLANLQDLQPSDVMRMMGDGLKATLLRGLQGSTALDIQFAMREFLNFYQDNYTKKTQPYEGIHEVLKELQDRGVLLGVLSNKREEFIEELLAMHFSDIDFKVKFGDTDARKRKPDPMGLLQACAVLQVNPQQVLMVGDSVMDMEAGLRANCGVLPVAWGYQSREALEAVAKTQAIDTASQILNIVNGVAI